MCINRCFVEDVCSISVRLKVPFSRHRLLVVLPNLGIVTSTAIGRTKYITEKKRISRRGPTNLNENIDGLLHAPDMAYRKLFRKKMLYIIPTHKICGEQKKMYAREDGYL